MSDKLNQGDGIAGRHETGRRTGDAIADADAVGDTETADALMARAAKTDPEAAAAALAERSDAPELPAGDAGGSEPGSETVMPDSDAPSRAGISGSGSGADNQGL